MQRIGVGSTVGKVARRQTSERGYKTTTTSCTQPFHYVQNNEIQVLSGNKRSDDGMVLYPKKDESGTCKKWNAEGHPSRPTKLGWLVKHLSYAIDYITLTASWLAIPPTTEATL